MTMTVDLSFPVGRFDRTARWTPESRRAAIADIGELPARLRAAVAGLDDARLDTPYRPGGWTVRQVVHHVADSHMNGYIRLKLALTEDNPTIKPYEQDRWAALPDSRLPIAPSLAILDAVHERWTVLWRSLGDTEFARVFTHPEMGQLTLETHLHLYSWHARHHTAHVHDAAGTRGVVSFRRAKGKRQRAKGRQQVLGCRHWALGCRHWALGCRHWALAPSA